MGYPNSTFNRHNQNFGRPGMSDMNDTSGNSRLNDTYYTQNFGGPGVGGRYQNFGGSDNMFDDSTIATYEYDHLPSELQAYEFPEAPSHPPEDHRNSFRMSTSISAAKLPKKRKFDNL